MPDEQEYSWIEVDRADRHRRGIAAERAGAAVASLLMQAGDGAEK
jgi:hypothetical protein